MFFSIDQYLFGNPVKLSFGTPKSGRFLRGWSKIWSKFCGRFSWLGDLNWFCWQVVIALREWLTQVWLYTISNLNLLVFFKDLLFLHQCTLLSFYLTISKIYFESWSLLIFVDLKFWSKLNFNNSEGFYFYLIFISSN